MSLIVTKNTYLRHPNVNNAEPGDEVYWKRGPGRFSLVRKSDGKTVFMIDGIRPDGKKYSTGEEPTLIGVIAHVEKHGWVLEVEKIE